MIWYFRVGYGRVKYVMVWSVGIMQIYYYAKFRSPSLKMNELCLFERFGIWYDLIFWYFMVWYGMVWYYVGIMQIYNNAKFWTPSLENDCVMTV